MKTNAQRPWWDRKEPTSSSGKYCYVSVQVSRGQNALELALEKASECGGFAYRAGTTNYKKKGEGRIEINGRTIKYKKIASKKSGYREYVLMMFSTERFKVSKKLPRKVYRAPFAFPLSAMVPGLGQIYKKRKGKGILFLTTTIGLGGAAYYFDTLKQDSENAFNNTAIFSEKQLHLDEYNKHVKMRNNFIIGAGVVYAINLIDALAIRGRRLAYNKPKIDKKFLWDIDYNAIANGPELKLRFRF